MLDGPQIYFDSKLETHKWRPSNNAPGLTAAELDRYLHHNLLQLSLEQCEYGDRIVNQLRRLDALHLLGELKKETK